METILKVENEGDLRRALLKDTPSYAVVDLAVQEIWPGRSAAEAKYEDDEGDFCTLTDTTFPDFLCTAKQTAKGQVFRLRLFPKLVAHSSSKEGLVEAPTVEPRERHPGVEEAFSAPWQHVDHGSSSDVGSDCLHTLADLTDLQQGDRDGDREDDAQETTRSTDYPLHPHAERSEAGAAQIAEVVGGPDLCIQHTCLKHEPTCDMQQQSEDQEPVVNTEESTTAIDQFIHPAEDEFIFTDVDVEAGAVVYVIHTPESSPNARGQADSMPYRAYEPPDDAPNMNVSPSARGQADSMPYRAYEPADPAQGDYTEEEKIDILIVAFDTNGDAHLNFEDCLALQQAGGFPARLRVRMHCHVAQEVFQEMCDAAGEDPEVGLGRDALMSIYAWEGCTNVHLSSRALHRDFEIAKQRLQGATPSEPSDVRPRYAPPVPRWFSDEVASARHFLGHCRNKAARVGEQAFNLKLAALENRHSIIAALENRQSGSLRRVA